MFPIFRLLQLPSVCATGKNLCTTGEKNLLQAGANSVLRVFRIRPGFSGQGLENVIIIGLFRFRHGADLLGQGEASADKFRFFLLL